MMDAVRRSIAYLSLPYFRFELPGWGKLYTLLSLDKATVWAGSDWVKFRPKLHGYQMEADLSDWSDRMSYFLGRHYDLETQRVMQALLHPGSDFVDVGGNVGHMSFLGAGLVTSSGHVHVFEPYPPNAERIRRQAKNNNLKQITLYPFALGDRDESSTLSLPQDDSHHGNATLRQPTSEDLEIVEEVAVQTRNGDSVLGPVLSNLSLIKIDVEGYEFRVLKGLKSVIEKHRPVIMHEINTEYLADVGDSPVELCAYMKSLGYTGYLMGLRKGPRRRYEFALQVLDDTAPGNDPTVNQGTPIAGDLIWCDEERHAQFLKDHRQNRFSS